MTGKKILEEYVATLQPLQRKVIQMAICNFPEYFWEIPASSTGKYHPVTDLGIGGLVRHTVNVCWMADTLAEAENLSADDRSRLIAAAIIHDSCKNGVSDQEKGKYTLFEHPLLPQQLLLSKELTADESQEWQIICNVSASHMGKYRFLSSYDVKNPSRLERIEEHFLRLGYIPHPVRDRTEAGFMAALQLPEPETRLQKLLHNADYLASRKAISLAYLYPEEASLWQEAEAAEMKAASEPATEKQIHAVQVMAAKLTQAQRADLGLPECLDSLGKKQASFFIGKMKTLLA